MSRRLPDEHAAESRGSELPASFAAFATDVEQTARLLAAIGSPDAVATGQILNAAMRALGTTLDLAAAAIRAAAPTSH